MYVRRTVLSNVRGFESLDLDFAPGDNFAGWAVVTGDNGTGKTALLRAMSLAILGPDQMRDLAPDLRGWTRHGSDSAAISVEILPHHDFDKTLKGGYPSKSTFWAEVGISFEGDRWSLTPIDVFRKKKKGATNGPWQILAGWLTLAYGPFRRLYGSSPDAQRLMVLPGRAPHFGTLFREDATLSEAEQWIKELNYKTLEKRENESRLLAGALQLINDDFLRNGLRIESVNSDGIWLADADGRRLGLSDMSEGYRSAVAMLLDIYRHMALTYGPEIVSVNDEGRAFVDRPGVVMIDEVDAHLHPDWQREIGFWLKTRFPQVQFIVTTHSPLVCQAADNGRVYHLPADGEPFQLTDEDFQTVVAGRPDQILLTPAFGLRNTRSDSAVNALRRHAELRAKRRASSLSSAEALEFEQLEMFAQAASTDTPL